MMYRAFKRHARRLLIALLLPALLCLRKSLPAGGTHVRHTVFRGAGCGFFPAAGAPCVGMSKK